MDGLEEAVRRFIKERGGKEEQYMRDAKDVVLEFYGVTSSSSRCGDDSNGEEKLVSQS